MSHSAMSTAEIAAMVTGPRRQYGPRYRYCQVSSMLFASRPSSSGSDVVAQVGGDRELAPVEGRVPEPDDAVARRELQGDEVAAPGS